MSQKYWLAFFAGSLCLLACGGGGGGGNSPTEPRAPQVITVEVSDFTFSPRSIQIQPGDTVRWVMRGSDRTHTVTARDGSFDSGAVFTSGGAFFERRFDTAGRTHEYWCSSHRNCCMMQGSVRVGQDAPPPNPGY